MSALKKILPQLRDFVRRADMFLFTVSVICAIYGIIVIASATKSYDNGSAQYVIVQGLALVLGGWYKLAGIFGFVPSADLAGVAPGIP